MTLWKESWRSYEHKTTWSRCLKWVPLTIVVLLVSPFVLQLIGFFQWSPLNCWHYDVDINSGRIRYTRFFAYICVRQRVEESALSRALQPGDYYGSEPNWHRVVTLSPRVHYSPNYVYGPAMSQIRELELGWKAGNFTPAAQRSSAKRVLEIWRREDGARPARSYLSALLNLNTTNSNIDEKDLPAPQ